jgi:hypothetical protein
MSSLTFLGKVGYLTPFCLVGDVLFFPVPLLTSTVAPIIALPKHYLNSGLLSPL